MRTFQIAVLSSALALTGCGDDDAGPADGGLADAARADGGPRDAASDAGPATPCADFTLPALSAEMIGTFSRPVLVTGAPGDDALYVVEAAGRIQRFSGGTATPFLDIRSTIGGTPTSGDERGLLGLAFHPGYATNGRFYVGYTPLSGSDVNVVAEYHRSAGDPTTADPTEVARLVAAADFAGNHNGGGIAFGPDGFLYAGMGDGGGAGDPMNNGLDTMELLGKMLRLDVDNAAGGYAAAGNPFAAGGGLPQIWSIGLRNPWRFSFDRRTGDLYIADVGQGTIEEIDFQPRSSTGGENYGWRAYEGDEVFSAADVSRVTDHTGPIFSYRHDGSGSIIGGCSVTGGHVYRGAAIPALDGVYFFGDYCSMRIVALRYCEGTVHSPQIVSDLAGLGSLVSFGEDNAGELYVVALEGPIFRVVPAR